MILVTGGAGYIGSHAVKMLLDKGEEVLVVDNFSRGYRQVIEILQKKYGQEKLKLVEVDLRDGEALSKALSNFEIKAVMHFAALCLVNESMEKPELYFENNVLGTLNLLKVIKDKKISKLVFSSTCAVYGESQYLPVDEKHPLNPTNPYGESKLIAEKMIRWFGEIHDLKYVIFRYFNVAGASSEGLIGDSKKPSQLLMQNAVRGALGIESFKLTCPKVATRDGSTVRDYIDVEDLVEAHYLGMKYLDGENKGGVINLGTGVGSSTLEIVNEVKRVTGFDFEVKSGEARKGEYAEIYANNLLAKELLGWQPKKVLKDSVGSLVKWYQLHPYGWDY